MSIRDRMTVGIATTGLRHKGDPTFGDIADAILAACPEIAALDHAREGWLCTWPVNGTWAVYDEPGGKPGTRVLVIDAPESS